MTMASRDIANMHLFLDLKKKFPDLPDETVRHYVPLYAENQEKCIQLLQKECENHYHPSQPFSDFRLPESKVNSSMNDYPKHFVGSPNDCLFPPGALQQSEIPALSKKLPPASGRSKSHAGVVGISGKPLSANPPFKPYTAPVITSSDKPFTDLYRQNPISSHSTQCQNPSDRNNQMIFSTTKQFNVESPVTHESKAYIPIPGEPDGSRKSGVKLCITPSFPFQQQQQVNVFSSPVCTTTSISRPTGRHTTSLSFQLQPQSSSEFPLEISTIPTNIGSPSNFRDFGSHLRVSVGPQGTTFTALRLQHPLFSQNTSPVAGVEGAPEEHRIPSSHAQNSSLNLFPRTRFQTSQGTKDVGQRSSFASNNASNQNKSPQSYESSPDYILAIKNQQIAQLDSLLRVVEQEREFCAQLKDEVIKMEQEITRRAATKSSFPYVEELHKLREEIRSLRVECDCLSREVDCAVQIPLGVTDEKIYSEIFPGPNGEDIPKTNAKDPTETKAPFEDEENDENNSWKCSTCTFKNHPALDKCEVCELAKNSGGFL